MATKIKTQLFPAWTGDFLMIEQGQPIVAVWNGEMIEVHYLCDDEEEFKEVTTSLLVMEADEPGVLLPEPRIGFEYSYFTTVVTGNGGILHLFLSREINIVEP